jgi:hypothetical protein
MTVTMARRDERLVVTVTEMGRSAARAARGAASVGSAAARHAFWYVRYQVDGTSRARRERPPRGRPPGR